ncbi:MAG TPA: diaminopimelate epimerase [Terriglobales bacterium]|nr:diaminopimelate epimerase [Terriglobales bacterium]
MNSDAASRNGTIPFTKASACGNDFILIDGMHAPADIPAFTRRICDRHDGVGADGVEWLFPDSRNEADVRIRLFNADGSEAEISGNGTRCVAAFLAAEQGKSEVVVRTRAGLKSCRLVSHQAQRFIFEMNMGEPQVGDEFSIETSSGEVKGVPVSMGNPHFVVFVTDFFPGWQAEAAEIGRHYDFKYGMNVELAIADKKDLVRVRFFERGVGETRSSGTGSCASAVAAIATGKCQSPLKVEAEGGSQIVRWEGDVFLTGPAQLLCRGEFFV